MKFTTTFVALVASATVAVASFTHAPGAPDGVYKHFTDADGAEHAEWVGPLNTTSTPLSRRSIYARGPSGVNCQTNIEMVVSDSENAENALANSFGGGLTFHKKISAVSGTAVAYGCDYGNGQTMYHDEFLGYMSAIGTNCGDASAGYYNLPSSKSSYGRTNSDQSFC